MRVRTAMAVVCLISLAALGARQEQTAPCRLEIALVEAGSGAPLPGIVRIVTAGGQLVRPTELVDRGQGVAGDGPINQWSVLVEPTTIDVPAVPLVVQAMSGLETELAEQPLDLTGKAHAKLTVPLARFGQARRDGYVAGNTHLHLMKLSREQADRYLQQVPLADGLDVVFLSYLERAEADLEYTSNKYTQDEIARLSHGHVHFGHGEEHRHNFGSHGEGYGHILLLDIPYIVRPVSIGPGIMHSGSDAPPMQVGIDKTRTAGGKVIWAHNLFGFEDIPNWITGRVDANNIFDGSHRGSYEDTYYRYLNIGLDVPFSTGTDWFIYDFSRAYVMTDRPITPTAWLDLLAAGKSYITNGPLLEFTVDGQPLGSRLERAGPGEAAIRGRAIGRSDFRQIELVHNGRVVETVPARAAGGHFEAKLDTTLELGGPSWLALRTPPPPAEGKPEPGEPPARNAFGHPLFAHTSPIYVNVDGRGVFDRATAEGLIAEMRADMQSIDEQAHFDDDAQRQQVMQVYNEAIERLRRRLAEQ